MVNNLTSKRAFATISLALAISFFGTSSRADSLADTFAIVHKSLALVATETSLGSAFVVQSDRSTSTLLTAAHVVGTATHVNVYLNDDPSVAYRADVTKIDKASDLAILTIHKGGLTPLDIATETREGTQIAVAGYPYASLKFLQVVSELKPSVHEGVVSAVRLGGQIIEYSATTDHGNSGGPVFDAASGYVVGVVSFSFKGTNGAYEATGIPAIAVFLKSANVSTATDYSSSATLPNVPGAYHILVVSGNRNANSEQASMLRQLVDDVSGKVSQQLGARVSVTDIDLSDHDAVSQACRDQNAIGTMWVGDRWSTKFGLWWTIDGGVEAILADCAGQPIFRSKKSKNAKVGSQTVSNDQVVSALADLDDQVAADLKAQADAASPTGLKNFLRYGYFIPDGEKKSMFQLKAGANGATVSWVDKRGTAARAGLQVGDLVTSLNGQSLIGVGQDPLAKMIVAAGPAGRWTMTVLAADGKPTDVVFESKDIRWYLSHPVH